MQAYYELKRSFLGYNVHYTPALPVGPPMRVPRMWGVDRDHRASLSRQGVHGETDREPSVVHLPVFEWYLPLF